MNKDYERGYPEEEPWRRTETQSLHDLIRSERSAFPSDPLNEEGKPLFDGVGNPEYSNELLKLQEEMIWLRRQHAETIEQYNKLLTAREQDASERADLEATLRHEQMRLARKEKLSDLLECVEGTARTRLLQDERFAGLFEEGPCEGFVMSVDIRRSTELMLRATRPALFAEFISSLCERLRQVIWNNHEVFDKFTGDGILAFFPVNFSGRHAGYFAIQAASQSHETFGRLYKEHRHCFDTVMMDVGLGIGIDYGTPHIVRHQWKSLTIVGKPVVYACRLSGAPTGQTLLNQQAYVKISRLFEQQCDFEETEINIKHEGRMLAYHVTLKSGSNFQPVLPDWYQDTISQRALPR